MKKFFMFIGVIVALLFLFNAAHATVWYVHPDSTLCSILTALGLCSTNDTVLVAPAIYYQQLYWPDTEGIDLISESGPDETIIDAGGTGVAIVVISGVDSTTIINGFTIRNGNYDWGGGITCTSCSSPTIINNIITGNSSHNAGGGILCIQSRPIITNNIITGNTAWSGGGIACISAVATITNNTITANIAGFYGGGGIVCEDHSLSTIAGNTITGNTAGAWGGGGILCDFFSSPTITNNTITNNTADIGGGIVCYQNSSPTIDSCTISGNNLDGIYCWDGSNPVINYNDITNNIAYGVRNIDPSIIVDATYNWWGDPSGPGGFGPGIGDSVSQYVDYDPWLDHPAGVEETEDRQQITEIRRRLLVYPNPFTTSTTITFIPPSIGQSAKGIGLKIYDVSGRLVKSVPLTAKTLTLGNDLIPGVYFLKTEGFDVGKIIKLR